MDWLSFLEDKLVWAASATAVITGIVSIAERLIIDDNEQNRPKKEILRKLTVALLVVTVILFVISCSPFDNNKIEENSTDASTETIEDTSKVEPTDTVSTSMDVQIGDTITFGSYEQDNYIANGEEPIEWVVLDMEDDSILVISKYALDQQQFHSQRTPVTWENSDIRWWLNNTFFNSAFSNEEKEMIITVTVTADVNPRYGNDPGNDTQDKIYIFSTEEAAKYFKTDAERVCYPTPYARSKPNVWIEDVGSVWWWLRTPGEFADDATTVNTDGKIDYKDGMVNSPTGTVRPVMWISIESLRTT